MLNPIIKLNSGGRFVNIVSCDSDKNCPPFVILERRPDDLVKGVGDIVGERPLDIADKAQGDVVIFRADPTGAGQAAVQHR